MDYSPHRETGGTMHAHSPTHHPHGYPLDGFTSISIDRIRRSLSRSPSKPQRFSLHTNTPNSPRSPISPLAVTRAYTPRNTADIRNASQPLSPLAQQQAPPNFAQATTTKKKLTLRRAFRASPRPSPRRALGDSLNQGNSAPLRRISIEEESPSKVSTQEQKFETDLKMANSRTTVNDDPVPFAMSARWENLKPAFPKSSPLKRSDGHMNLNLASSSPSAKRRSLHGASFLGVDVDIPDHGLTVDAAELGDAQQEASYVFSSTPKRSPPPRLFSQRKNGPRSAFATAPSRHKASKEPEFALPVEAASKARNRMSLPVSLAYNDQSSHPFVSNMSPNPFSRTSTPTPSGPSQQSSFLAKIGGNRQQQPHPLSNALTPSSSTSSFGFNSPRHVPEPAPFHHGPSLYQRLNGAVAPQTTNFGASLPIGAMRPQLESQTEASGNVFETPAAVKMPKPDPRGFMSTGMVPIKRRGAEQVLTESYIMPDTPSKKFSIGPTAGATPFKRSTGRLLPEYDTLASPSHSFTPDKAIYGRRGNLFNTNTVGAEKRRMSFQSIDGDQSGSPVGQMDSQSSVDELPPTPTKNGSDRDRKSNSLRSRMFGRRTSINNETFQPPTAEEVQSPRIGRITPIFTSANEQGSPHTPSEEPACIVPDPSSLSISNHGRHGSFGLRLNAESNSAFMPATPTAPRGDAHFFNQSNGPVHGVTDNDVDPALTARFAHVKKCGAGVFSDVFKVENPISTSFSTTPPSGSLPQAWAVKRSKAQMNGAKEREKQYREVEILAQLRHAEHIVQFTNSWEADRRLYIQTEFCEDGNLQRFLEQSIDGRMDDFRIWKILLELSLGVQAIHDAGFIHLDLKPANILIDFEGVLKIADFGLAHSVPVADGIEANEGDRTYMALELFDGKYDKPADIYSMGLILLSLATDHTPPENGAVWTELRAGSLSSVPSLTVSINSLVSRDRSSGLPPMSELSHIASGNFHVTSREDGSMIFVDEMPQPPPVDEKVQPPNFAIDPTDPSSLEHTTEWLIASQPSARPTVQQVLLCEGVRWAAQRRRFGATIWEGRFGPASEVLESPVDVDMPDA